MLDRKQPPHLAKKRIITVASNLMGVALYSIMGDKNNKEMSVQAQFAPKKKVLAKQNFKEGQFLVHSAFPNVTPPTNPLARDSASVAFHARASSQARAVPLAQVCVPRTARATARAKFTRVFDLCAPQVPYTTPVNVEVVDENTRNRLKMGVVIDTRLNETIVRA